ncbi:hypothetical protein QTO01_11220 [Vibrio mytili]|uniref:hypothetical protein n=1 Tax=Vibrio mytili TaxID=50718 RepID=UPI002F400F56
MATNTIGRLAVALDLNSAQFSQKLKKAKTETAGAKKGFAGLTGNVAKFAARMAPLAAAVAIGVAAINKIGDGLDTAMKHATDFSASMDKNVRATMLQYAEDTAEYTQRANRAWDGFYSKFAPIATDIKDTLSSVSATIGDVASGFMDLVNNVIYSNEELAEMEKKSAATLALYERQREIGWEIKNLRVEDIDSEERKAKMLSLQNEQLRISQKLSNNASDREDLQKQIDLNNKIYQSNKQKNEQEKADEAKRQAEIAAIKERAEQDRADKIAQIRAKEAERQAKEEAAAAQKRKEEAAAAEAEEEARLDTYHQAFIDRAVAKRQREIKEEQEAAAAKQKIWSDASDGFQQLSDTMANMNMGDSFAAKMAGLGAIVTKQIPALIALAEVKALGSGSTWYEQLIAYGQIASIAASIGGSLGQFHDGVDRVPKTGSYVLQEGEMVVPRNEAAKARANGGGSGGNNITIAPTLNSSGRDAESENQLLSRMKMMIINDIKNNGQLGRTIRKYA